VRSKGRKAATVRDRIIDAVGEGFLAVFASTVNLSALFRVGS
jgi:hypothetical protein